MAKTAEAPVSFVQITDCCCGVRHRMKEAAWIKYRRTVKDKPPTILVGNGFGCWRVPRIWIACHGLAASELRDLAVHYGWEQVRL